MKHKITQLLAEIEQQIQQVPPEDLQGVVLDITEDLRGLVTRLEAAVGNATAGTAKSVPAADEDPLEGYFDNMPV
ncbi:hypothetical protein [Thalassovita sp.]|jgi:chorismate mutase|uniref:hypothetical protein n=1 Tax=Thalassovita sp. TaxID=1979401 RepID=UPI002AB078D3|nr:hypothetical protein [Thalassovita sp.]|tara:strand:- start:739 stop:963 length:225 start_codon:yes stop_codon:yes gene_type:complete